MTYYEPAIQVLRSARCPLTTREIAERAIETELIKPHGKTPAATMSAFGAPARLSKLLVRRPAGQLPTLCTNCTNQNPVPSITC